VPGNLCEIEVPPIQRFGDHQIKCHLSDVKFAEMEPVIKVAAE